MTHSKINPTKVRGSLPYREEVKMCSSCSKCFSKEGKTKLKEKGWTEYQIAFAEGSVIEDKIKELIK